MRILHVHNPHRVPGGEDQAVAAERQLLRAAGHEVLAYDEPNPESSLAAARKFVQAPWNVGARHRLVELAQSLRPEVVHVHNTWFALSPAIFSALTRAGHRVVATAHNYRMTCSNALLDRQDRPCTLCVKGSSLNGVRYRCYRSSLPSSVVAASTVGLHKQLGTWWRHVERFVVLTEFSREIHIAAGIPEAQVEVVANHTWDPGPRVLPPSSSQSVLFVGRDHPRKGLDVLLEAWQQWSPANRQLVVVGADGSKLPPIAGVIYTGLEPPDEVRRRMAEARFLVVPSQTVEGMPMVAVEAFSAGLPVLASDLGALPQIVAEAGRAVAPAHDPMSWREALSEFDAADLDGLSTAARGRYEAEHTPESALSRLQAVYERALAS